MSDPDLPPLDEDVRALVRRAAAVQPAPPGARSRVLNRVEHIVGPPGGGGGDGGSAGSGGASLRTSDATGAAKRLLRRVLPLAASFGLGGGVVAIAMQRPPEPARIVYVDRPSETASVAQPPTDPNGTPVPPSERVPAPASSQAPVPSAIAPPSGRPLAASPSRDQLTAERQLLDLARGALEREDAQAALDATARHERGYPNGALVQEREAMAIRALVLLKRTTEARARADRFRDRFPHSLLLPTIESNVGGDRLP